MSNLKQSVPAVITPTVGRQVWFFPAPHFSVAGAPGPLAATVVHVHSDRMVNVAVYDSNGRQFAETSVVLVQPGDEVNPGVNRCEWMPYQQGQAKKAEAAEAALKDATNTKPMTEGERLKGIVEGRDVAANPGRDLNAKPCDDKNPADCGDEEKKDKAEEPASSWVKK